MITQFAPWCVAAILIAATVFELKTGKIPNWLTLLPFVVFVIVVATAADKSAYAWQLVLAAGVFVVGLLLFAFGGFGAGAVKLLSGLALFVPPSSGLAAVGIFFGSLVLVTIVLVQLRKRGVGADGTWHVFTTRNTLPISLPLAMTGVAVLLWL